MPFVLGSSCGLKAPQLKKGCGQVPQEPSAFSHFCARTSKGHPASKRGRALECPQEEAPPGDSVLLFWGVMA